MRPRPAHDPTWTELDIAGKIDASMKGSRTAVQAVFAEGLGGDVLDLVAELRCPTLLLRADVANGGIVDDEAVALVRANPLVTVVTIPEADHNIHRGRFTAFMAQVQLFLASG